MQTLSSAILLAQTELGGDPNPDGLPGSRALQSLVGGVAFWALRLRRRFELLPVVCWLALFSVFLAYVAVV